MSDSSQQLAETAIAQPAGSSSRASRRGGMLAPLGFRDYRLLFAGQLISLIGDAFYAVALPWYMLTRGGGAASLGLVLTAYGVPLGAATLLGGWLSDRLRPRRVMLFSDFIRTFILLGLAWLTFGGGAPFLNSVPLWSIAAFTAALGLFDGMFTPASNAIAPDLLPDDQLQAANGLFYAMARFVQMTGPAFAGAVVASVGSPFSFAIDATTFAVSTLTLALIRSRASKPIAPVAPDATVEAGAGASPASGAPGEAPAPEAVQTDSLWRFALTTPYFLILLLVLVVANLFNGAAEVAFPALANGPLRTNAQGFGFMLSAIGAGGLVGGLLASALGNRINRGWISLLFFAIQVIPISALAFAPSIAIAVACMAGFGVLNGLGNVSFLTLVQRKLPRNLMGRIMGVFAFTNFASFPLSVAAAGFAVAQFGPRPVILAGAVVLAGAIIAAFFNRDLRNL